MIEKNGRQRMNGQVWLCGRGEQLVYMHVLIFLLFLRIYMGYLRLA